MARTIVTTDNSRGSEVSASNPTYAHIRGWNVGVRVEINPEGTELDIYVTSGSHARNPSFHVGSARIVDGVAVFDRDERDV